MMTSIKVWTLSKVNIVLTHWCENQRERNEMTCVYSCETWNPTSLKTKTFWKVMWATVCSLTYTLHKVYPHQVYKLVTNTLGHAMNCQMGEA
jgi:hypothetical protein